MNTDFYQVAKTLEDIKNIRNPSKDQIEIILQLVSEEKYSRYFFYHLDNPVWITPLHNNGFFFQPPNPIEVQPGSFQLPGWPAGEYLARFADQYEAIVMEVVRSIRTENWRVQEILIDAMMKISPNKAAELVAVIDDWLSGRFSDMLPDKLISLAGYLWEHGLSKAAIQILEYVITPVLPPVASDYSKYRSPVRFRSDHYWVSEYCAKQFPKVVQSEPTEVVLAFERQLEKAIELTKGVNLQEGELQIGYYWRIDIPNRLSERSDADALDILIDGLRDGLVEVCQRDIKNGEPFLRTYLNSEHIIFKRIGMYTLRKVGKDYPEFVNQVLLQREYLEDYKYANEYRGVMRDQFGVASEEVRTQVISWILSGPSDVEVRANRRAQRENREVTNHDRVEIRERWTLYHLEIVRDFVTGEALSRLEELTDRYGTPDIEEWSHVAITSWGGAPSPVSAEELAKKSFNELKSLFLTYIPNDLFLNPRESLAQTFQRLVSEDPARYDDFAVFITDPAIRFVYIYHYLLGIREGMKNKDGRLGDGILSLCEYIVAQNEDPFIETSGVHEPGLFAAQMEVAHLLEGALQSDDLYLTKEQLDRIRSLLITLSHHPDPMPGSSDSTGLDPFTHSLNCIRGVAMHGIFRYSLYLVNQQEKQTGQSLQKGYLESEIQQLLEEKLDLTKEPSLAVHAVYGVFTPSLHYLSDEWLERHLASIFPEDEAYWRAAWDAYISVCDVYPDVFRLLIPQYQRGLRLLSQPQDEEKRSFGSPHERLAQHLMSAYLTNLTDFNHENGLLELFFINAPDAIRAQGIFWLGKVLENIKPSSKHDLWRKCWLLWQKRLEFTKTQEVSQNSQEISEYIQWLENCPVELGFLYPILQQSVKYLPDDFHARQLIEYAARYGDRFSLEAVSLLQQTILSAKEPWWRFSEKDEEKILKAAMASGDEKARQIAVAVINYQGECGDFRWRPLLD